MASTAAAGHSVAKPPTGSRVLFQSFSPEGAPSLPPPSTSPPPPPPPPDNSPPPPPDNSPPPPPPPDNSPPAPVIPSLRPSSPPSLSPPISVSSPPPPSADSSQSSSSSSMSTHVVVGIAAGGALLVAVVVLLIFCLRRKKERPSPVPHPPPPYHGAHVGFDASMQQSNWQDSSQYPNFLVRTKPPQTAKTGQDSYPVSHSSAPPSTHSTTEVSGSRYSYSSGQEHALLRLSPKRPGSPLDPLHCAFTYAELVRASDGFSDANLLGQGGFGYVHRGVLQNGEEVAIKQLKSGSTQGEREFQAEVEIISRVHHRHLVSLVGYCIHEDKRLLVYEFVPNNTLEFHLHGKGRPAMDWSARTRIAIGSAKGLAYLHEDCHPKIVHRDIKTANILLDYKFEAKVADFGLAKFFSDEHTQVTTRIMGTLGYLAPEYASSGKVTYKSDVFSFGVMLLELITGRRPVDHMAVSLVDLARPLLLRAIDEDNFDDIADSQLNRKYDPNQMACMVACAAACIRHSASHRPRMSQIVRVLEGGVSVEELNAGITPGQSSVYGSDESGPQMVSRSTYMRTLFTARENESSEFSDSTSEYGRHPYESTAKVTEETQSKATKERNRTRFK